MHLREYVVTASYYFSQDIKKLMLRSVHKKIFAPITVNGRAFTTPFSVLSNILYDTHGGDEQEESG